MIEHERKVPTWLPSVKQAISQRQHEIKNSSEKKAATEFARWEDSLRAEAFGRIKAKQNECHEA